MELVATNEQTIFYNDVVEGLGSSPKYLQAKYLYDDEGDKLFQEIMACEEYYPFRCELEIFTERSAELAKIIIGAGDAFDLIELGAGDCTKSSHLLKRLMAVNADFTYMPIDISARMIERLAIDLPVAIPGIDILGLRGEYFNMLRKATRISGNRKVVLFLGSNLGNMTSGEAALFSRELHEILQPGDLVLVGLDLKKRPSTILAAYNDKRGITRDFNLNLLKRINRDFRGDFKIDHFEHYPMYDPSTGSCKSYLISLMDQRVTLQYGGEERSFDFGRNEALFMEISQKYTADEVDFVGRQASFETVKQFFDKRKWFVDTIWRVI